MLTMDDLIQARERLRTHLTPTPLENAPTLGEQVWLKLENANLTHSFKIRGALNAVLALDDSARLRGLVTASSGNHAQGLAYAAHLTGAKATILMPEHTPQRKVDGVRKYGAEARLFGANYDETEAEARRLERENGMTFVSPYNDPMVVAGAASIGLEIIDAQAAVERVVVCVGGGGLISGIGMAIKTLNPMVEVIGVNAESASAMYNIIYDTNYAEVWDTLAEALSGDVEPDSITREMVRQYVDGIVRVSEAQIAAAMRWMVNVQGWLVEGGGAVGVAALLAGIIPEDGKRTVVVVSGANVDPQTLRQVLCEA